MKYSFFDVFVTFMWINCQTVDCIKHELLFHALFCLLNCHSCLCEPHNLVTEVGMEGKL